MDPKRPTSSHNPNASLYVFKNSATKRSTPSGSRLNTKMNETVCVSSASSSTDLSTQIVETESDVAYNDYLQAFMKQEVISSEIVQQENILKGQIALQSENLRKRNNAYKETMKEVDFLKEHIVSIELIHSLESNIERSKSIYQAFQARPNIEKVVSLLRAESDRVVLKNIKMIRTQEEYDKLMDVMRHFNGTMEKIVKSGRNFSSINHLANEIKHFLELSDRVHASLTVTSDLEKHAISSLLRILSDNFAKQYD